MVRRESEGHVLFLRGDGAAMLLEQTLVGYIYSPSVFALLTWWMFGEPRDDVQIVQLRSSM